MKIHKDNEGMNNRSEKPEEIVPLTKGSSTKM